ncbi:hypothetical protein [Mesorhizobium sp. CA5]|uniref:hypothetical protein n=1 Tax=Mesorhizobium sp. CA5 TaxID=2876638 RepID=UPI001CD152D9|nr:hypothetical protein [Mesorhizobium sp. CA5]MBZ9843353.1 hypothetical protein [Mesorhizobium sp. CA5]
MRDTLYEPLSAIPAAAGLARLPVSRRQVLAFLAAAPALPGLADAFAAERRDDGQLALRFDLSADGRELQVVRVEKNQPASGFEILKLNLEMFGPEAWFDLGAPPADARTRQLYVRNIAYGDLINRNIELFFENSGAWKVRLLTDAWLDSKGNSLEYKTESPVFLDDFVSGRAELVETLPASRLTQTFRRMLEGRIDAGAGREDVLVGLNSQFQWHLAALQRKFTVFGGQVEIADLVVGWYRDGTAVSADQGPYLAALGTTASLDKLEFGGRQAPRMRLVRPQPARAAGWQVEIRRGPSALKPNTYQTVTRIAIGGTETEFWRDGARVAGPIAMERSVATETAIVFPDKSASRSKRTVRTVFSARSTSDPKGEGRTIDTPIGRVRADGASEPAQPDGRGGAQPAAVGPAATPQDPAHSLDEFGKIALAACGDRSAVADQTAWVVADSDPKARSLRRAAIDLELLEADAALPDVSHSRLLFDRAELRLAFSDGRELGGLIAEAPVPERSSFIWLDDRDGTQRQAALDLGRATLAAARDYDQMRLRFRFRDVALAFTPQPMLLNGRADCGVFATQGSEPAGSADGEGRAQPEPVRIDTRPVLVVEFDPQHVMEEAIFLPEPPPLPDVALDPGEQSKLANASDEKGRQAIQDAKVAKEEKDAQDKNDHPFADFCAIFAKAEETKLLSKAQRIYIGPDGLDPDAFEAARKLQALSLGQTIQNAVDQLVDIQARDQIAAILASAAANAAHTEFKRPITDRGLRLALESSVETSLPLYALFRSFYRDLMTGAAKVRPAEPPLPEESASEYFHPNNRDGVAEKDLARAGRRDTDAREKFSDFAAGRDDIPDIVEARLSGPTRLAFRLNCRPGVGDGSDSNGLAATPAASSARPGAAGVAFDGMPFTFAALTDWSHHEPAVTRRAEKLFRELPSGVLAPLGEQAADLDDRHMLDYQSLSAGEDITGAQRMAEIRASLAKAPNALETAIEIPSRLLLSTAQDAVWQTTRRFPIPEPDTAFADPPAVLEAGREVVETGAPIASHSRDLWTARLLIEDVQPGLRVVGTPDYRPMALEPATRDSRALLPGHFAPPRGAYAPWFLGKEQAASGASSPRDAFVERFGDPDKKWEGVSDEAFCAAAKEFQPPRKLRLVDWLCRRLGIRSQTERDIEFFRTSLDAYDRHELMLLTSAFGLPVTGKRQAVGDNVELSGALVDGSGQFEPGAEFALLDGRADEAIYRPVALNATELTLSTLGGSFSHDTHFNPPATALDIDGLPFFNGMTIERWQHDIVLSRDIRAEVVYKGYLFPLGHRASLVKLTERIFLLTKNQGYKALLRQRMFLRVGKPEKQYPAVGQPNAGRQWCASHVEMLTRRTPDIVDPTTPVGPLPGDSQVGPNGMLSLGDQPGLAFWPKVDLTDQGIISFQFTLDGKKTSMPLLFLDNVAATTPAAVRKAAEYYNTNQLVRRDMPLHGQKLRFAEEKESGDTTFATDRVMVVAQGRQAPGGSTWEGDNTLYETTGVLEGAEQPPFYPAVDIADIHIEQVERFTGSGTKPTSVRYDGHFLAHGFPREEGAVKDASDVAAAENPVEVFLDLTSPVKLDMAGSGDRSGGIARPNSMIQALSRSKGPLGADEPSIERRPPSTIVSMAKYFSSAVPEKTAGAAPAAPGDGASAPAKMDVFKGFFSSDAKLLGLITLKDLMSSFDLAGADLPLLKEAIEFGSALQKTTSDALALVRTNVLLPLRTAIDAIAAQWDALDQRLQAEQKRQAKLIGQDVQIISIKTYFPEIEDGLAGLRRLLDDALAENDLLKLPKKLSAVYEAGKRFARVLSALAANAPERVQEAVRSSLVGGISGILAAKTALETALTKIQAVGQGDAPAAVAAVAGELIASVKFFDDIIPLPVPVPDLVAAVRVVADPTPADIETAAQETAALLRGAVSTDVGGLRDAIGKAIGDLATGAATPEAATADLAKTIINAAAGAIDGALDHVKDNVDEPYRSRLVAEVEVYRARLKLVGDGVGKRPIKLPPALSQLMTTLTRLQDGGKSVVSFVSAVKNSDIEAALAASGSAARQLFGVEVDLSNPLTKSAGEAANAIDTLARSLGFTSDSAQQWPTDEEVETAVMADLPDTLPASGSALMKLAKAWQTAGQLNSDLALARTAFTDHKDELPLPLQHDVDGVLSDTQTLAGAVRGQIGEAYRHTVHLGQGLQMASRSLRDFEKLSPANGDTPDLARLLQRLEAARAIVESGVDGLFDTLQAISEAVKAYITGKPNNADALGLAFAAKLGASADIQNAVKTVEASLKSAQAEIAGYLTLATSALLKLLANSCLLTTAGIAALKKIFADLPKVLDPERQRVVDALAALEAAIPADLPENFGVGIDPQTIADFLALTVKKDTTVEKFFFGGGAAEFNAVRDRLRAAEAAAMSAYRSLFERASALPKPLQDKAFHLVQPAFALLATGYAEIVRARDKVLADPSLAKGLAKGLVREALVVEPDPTFPHDGDKSDRLGQEAGWIADAAAASDFSQVNIRQELSALLEGWRNHAAAPQVIANNLKQLVVKATSGDILSMIDVAALRDEIEDALANLVPLRTTLAYDLNLASGGGTAEGEIFQLLPGTKFDVAVRVDIDLLGQDPVRFRADAKLGAFQVNLLGGIFDAVTLRFRGASFLIEDGGKPSFDVDYDTFEIGDELKFAQQLQSFLSPSDSGFYLQSLDGQPGIEAGYGLNLGTIQLGGISFSNVSLNVAALLPFTDSEAQFRASLARRLAPFTISVPPFGGSGYFAITANAKSIVGFEASFEFGGSADFSFGPLVAYGRIMSGFYIRTQTLPSGNRVTDLSGTFFAGGAASIWIFSCYASLYVKLGMKAGGAMEGEAIFSFSFSMGIVDYDYSVRVSNSQPAMGSQQAALDSSTRFADADGIDPIITGSAGRPADDRGFDTGALASTVCAAADPVKYFAYFDHSLLEDAL